MHVRRERIDNVIKGGGKSWSIFSQFVLSLTPKYSVTNNLMQVTYKIILSLNDRSIYTFETFKKTNNCLYVKELFLISESRKHPHIESKVTTYKGIR